MALDGIRWHQMSSNVIRRIGKNVETAGKKDEKKYEE